MTAVQPIVLGHYDAALRFQRPGVLRPRGHETHGGIRRGGAGQDLALTRILDITELNYLLISPDTSSSLSRPP
jgi:hypothetical protein